MITTVVQPTVIYASRGMEARAARGAALDSPPATRVPLYVLRGRETRRVFNSESRLHDRSVLYVYHLHSPGERVIHVGLERARYVNPAAAAAAENQRPGTQMVPARG